MADISPEYLYLQKDNTAGLFAAVELSVPLWTCCVQIMTSERWPHLSIVDTQHSDTHSLTVANSGFFMNRRR